jgi:hypothetical protein
MRRPVFGAAVLGTACAAVAGAACTAAPATARHVQQPPPARLLVYAQEWSLWRSRASLPAGQVIVQLWNRGQDAHDLRIRRVNRRGQLVGPTQGVHETQAGALRAATWKLKQGHYELYCSLPQHRKRGMHARIAAR